MAHRGGPGYIVAELIDDRQPAVLGVGLDLPELHPRVLVKRKDSCVDLGARLVGVGQGGRVSK